MLGWSPWVQRYISNTSSTYQDLKIETASLHTFNPLRTDLILHRSRIDQSFEVWYWSRGGRGGISSTNTQAPANTASLLASIGLKKFCETERYKIAAEGQNAKHWKDLQGPSAWHEAEQISMSTPQGAIASMGMKKWKKHRVGKKLQNRSRAAIPFKARAFAQTSPNMKKNMRKSMRRSNLEEVGRRQIPTRGSWHRTWEKSSLTIILFTVQLQSIIRSPDRRDPLCDLRMLYFSLPEPCLLGFWQYSRFGGEQSESFNPEMINLTKTRSSPQLQAFRNRKHNLSPLCHFRKQWHSTLSGWGKFDVSHVLLIGFCEAQCWTNSFVKLNIEFRIFHFKFQDWILDIESGWRRSTYARLSMGAWLGRRSQPRRPCKV